MDKAKIGSSGSEIALCAVATIGSALMFVFDSTQAQNAIQLTACAALAAVIVRGQIRARIASEATMRLASELLLVRRAMQGDDPQDCEASGPVAPVILLPASRRSGDGPARGVLKQDHR